MYEYIKNLPTWVKYTGRIALGVLIVYLIFRDRIDSYLIGQAGLLDGDTDLDGEKVLSRGSRGAEVAELQRLLKQDGAGDILGSTGPNGDGVDGVFGPKTESALQQIRGVVEVTLNAYPNIRKMRGGFGPEFEPSENSEADMAMA